MRSRLVVQKNKEAEEYANLLAKRKAEIRERRSESLAKKRAARMASQASATA
jgi:small subunit ribosomal protein S6e